MKRKLRRMKVLGLLGSGCMLFFGGCNLDAGWNRFQIGFVEQFGAIAATTVFDLITGAADAGDLTFCAGGQLCED